MTTFHNLDVSRKSSVYNQTGQSYDEQLSAYNHMSTHLRRILLARSVVDSRNKKYMRDKRLDCKSPIRSKSLDKILARGDIIDGLAYDTEHHPIDVLRMSLESAGKYRRTNKRISDYTCTCCNVKCYAQCRGVSSRTTRGAEMKSEIARSVRMTANNSDLPIRHNNQRSSCESARQYRLNETRCGRQSEIDRSRRKIRVRDDSRTRSDTRSNRITETIGERYSYNSSFESSSDTSEVDSPVENKKFTSSSPRTSRVTSADRAGIELSQQLRKSSDTVEPPDETKYAKFLYDITQEIMLNQLYTDRELQEIFKKHVEMNSESLDRNKMLSEIYQLKMSLNVAEFSDDEGEGNHIESLVDSERFAKLSPKKPPTPSKILDENKLVEKVRNNQESWRFDESHHRSKSSYNNKNKVVPVDANPNIYVTERDVLLTLIGMKLDPGQVRTICKSLQSKSKETSPSQTVKVDPSYPLRKEDRENSPIKRRVERATIESFNSPSASCSTIGTRRDETTETVRLQDGTTQAAIVETAKKTKGCECQCRDTNSAIVHPIVESRETKLPKKTEESQTEEKQPEVAIQTTIDSESRGVLTSTSFDQINRVSIGSRKESSEFQALPEISQALIRDEDDSGFKNETLRGSLRVDSLKFCEKTFSETDEEEQSESMENDDKEITKKGKMKKKRVSTLKKKTGQKEARNSKPLSKLKEEPIESSDEIIEIAKTRRKKSTIPNKSSSLAAEKSAIDDKDSIRVSEEPKEPDLSMMKLSKASMRNDGETNISENSKASKTYIVTEKDSHVTSDNEKIYEITDNELTSLSEEFSQIEESQIVEEISSIVGSEKAEDSQIPEALEKSQSISSKISSREKLEKFESVSSQISSGEKLKKSKSISSKISSGEKLEKSKSISSETSSEEKLEKSKCISSKICSGEKLEKFESIPSEISSGEKLEKSKSSSSETCSGEKLEMFDESKEEKISMNESTIMKNLDRNLQKDLNDCEQPRATKIPSHILNENESMNEERKGLTSELLDPDEFPNDDESSISEDLAEQATAKNRVIVVGSDEDVDPSRISSLELEREKESDDEDVMTSAINSDENSEKVISDKESQESRDLSEQSINIPSTTSKISEYNISGNRFGARDCYSPSAEKMSINDELPNKRMKKTKNKELICSPCIAKLIGKSKPRNSSTKLDASRSSFKTQCEKKRTTFREDPMTTTASDISLLRNDNFDESVQLSFENAPEVADIHDEGPSYLEYKDEDKDEKKETLLPWMPVERDLANQQQERLEVSAPRRDTIHRKTSLIRSLRIAVKNMNKRRTTVTSVSRSSNFQEFLPEVESSSSTGELKENVPETIERNSIANSSLEDSSNEKIEPGLKIKTPGTIQRNEMNRSSSESSEDARMQPESKEYIPETIQRDEMTNISRKNAQSSTIHYSRAKDKNSSVTSAKNNRCKSDCTGYRLAGHQMHLYASPSDFCERLRSSNSSSLDSIISQRNNDE